MPRIEVSPWPSTTGSVPPRSVILHLIMLVSWLIGLRPTAMQTVSTSKRFSVPGMGWKWLSTCAMTAPVT